MCVSSFVLCLGACVAAAAGMRYLLDSLPKLGSGMLLSVEVRCYISCVNTEFAAIYNKHEPE